MTALARRAWVPAASEELVQQLATEAATRNAEAQEAELERLVRWNREIHELASINLNPATNTPNPRAEAMLARGLGQRPSLGYPGDKYEMGLEAIERIEVIAAELAAEVFGAKYAEIRVGSGALANLYAFMATTTPGDAIIAPPAEIGGHVTHHAAGAAGLYGLITHAAPVDADSFTVDVDRLRTLAHEVRPRLITVCGSFNLQPHPLATIRAIADEVDAKVLYDAAHMSGMIAGKAWQQPLAEGAHLMTMSTYKSFGGVAGGLVLTDDAALAERLDAIAYPGLTANFDAAKSAALAITLLDWKEHGRAYAEEMAATAKALALALEAAGLPVHGRQFGFTRSHQLAIEAAAFGGGHRAAKRLRAANMLSSAIGLPLAAVAGDANGLRLGTNEIVRWGMGPGDMPDLARFIARALTGNQAEASMGDLAAEVSRFRRRFNRLHFIRT